MRCHISIRPLPYLVTEHYNGTTIRFAFVTNRPAALAARQTNSHLLWAIIAFSLTRPVSVRFSVSLRTSDLIGVPAKTNGLCGEEEMPRCWWYFLLAGNIKMHLVLRRCGNLCSQLTIDNGQLTIVVSLSRRSECRGGCPHPPAGRCAQSSPTKSVHRTPLPSIIVEEIH